MKGQWTYSRLTWMQISVDMCVSSRATTLKPQTVTLDQEQGNFIYSVRCKNSNLGVMERIYKALSQADCKIKTCLGYIMSLSSVAVKL